MYLTDLHILQVRNLEDVRVRCHPKANILCGPNGSGKTSFLEAIYLLGRGRSFRQRDIRVVVRRGADNLVVSGKVAKNIDEPTATLGVMRSLNGRFEAKLNGESLYSALDLTQALPIQLIDAHSFLLLEGGPKQRRQFIDWGVFHVEHSFKELWRRFQKVLKQRNELLRRDRIDVDLLNLWSGELVPLSEQISTIRRSYLNDLADRVCFIAREFGLSSNFKLDYYQGWGDDLPLKDVLESDRRRDLAVKRTHSGPHRADLRIKVDGLAAATVLSRGQIKLLVYALKLAQVELYREKNNTHCLFLLDDLPAELDHYHREKVLSQLDRLGGQYFVTGVARQDLEQALSGVEYAMFHVEHGTICEIEK